MPFFVVFYGCISDHPLHPPYRAARGSDHVYVHEYPVGLPPLPDGATIPYWERYPDAPNVRRDSRWDDLGFTVSGARFDSREGATSAAEAANAEYGKPAPYAIVEAPDEESAIEKVSGKPRRRLISIRDERFLQPVREALERNGELLLFYIRSHAGGAGEHWFLVRNEDDLQSALATGRPKDFFEAFLDPQLPLRGAVDDGFERRVLDRYTSVTAPQDPPPGWRWRPFDARLEPRTAWLLLAVIHPDGPDGIELDWAERDTPEDVSEWLHQHWGQHVAVGQSPADRLGKFKSAHAYVPDEFGNVRAGAY